MAVEVLMVVAAIESNTTNQHYIVLESTSLCHPPVFPEVCFQQLQLPQISNCPSTTVSLLPCVTEATIQMCTPAISVTSLARPRKAGGLCGTPSQ